jgi:EpsI family protein
MTRWQRWAPVGLLVLGGLSVSGLRPQHRVPPRRPIAALAVTVPGYQSEALTISAEEQAVAGMSAFALRQFVRDSADRFTTYVGYYDYQVQGKTIHSPRNCLPGAGWETVQGGTVLVLAAGGPPVAINRFLLANGGARALVYYWYQGRGRVEANEYRVKWHLLRDAALHGRTEEALVRIVVPLPGGVPPTALAAHLARADTLAVEVAAQLLAEVALALPTPA